MALCHSNLLCVNYNLGSSSWLASECLAGLGFCKALQRREGRVGSDCHWGQWCSLDLVVEAHSWMSLGSEASVKQADGCLWTEICYHETMIRVCWINATMEVGGWPEVCLPESRKNSAFPDGTFSGNRVLLEKMEILLAVSVSKAWR